MASIEETVTYTSGDLTTPPALRLLHYNDVYHVEAGSREPVGGIARFQTLCNYYRNDDKFAGQPELLTLFSGDAFNPSLESTVTKGSHMVPVLNNINTNAACLGNHDLDFGVERFEILAARCQFPWLVANVLDPAFGEDIPLGNCKRTVILEASNGLKVGLIGLVEREWLDTINTLPPNLKYLSASATAKELAPKLREQGADIIIALTHQREPNDNKLASNTPPGTIDLILGGHDHYYSHTLINNTHILRSGSDFKQLSYLELRLNPTTTSPRTSSPTSTPTWNPHILRRDILSSILADPPTLTLTASLTETLQTKLSKPLGYTLAPLDARFTTVRRRESNYGNFITDLMRHHYGTEACIIASGTIRGDQIYPPGVLRVRDIMNCFPFEDPCVVVRVSGKGLVQALENGVGTFPALEGRFPQVSGISFSFDPRLPPGRRCSDVRVGGEPVVLERKYTLATRDYMVRGKDGFASLMLVEHGGEAESVVREENGLLISMLLRQYFMSLKVLGRWRACEGEGALGRHWEGVKGRLHEVHPVGEPVGISKEGDLGVKGEETRARETLPSLVGRAQVKGQDGERVQLLSDDSSDDEGDMSAAAAMPGKIPDRERKLVLMRKVMRKWWRLAGMKGHPNMCEGVGEEFGVHWTRGIAPREEGRMRCLA